VEAARRQIGKRPPLDLSFATAEAAEQYAAASGGSSLAPNHVRLTHSGAVPSLTGFSEGGWWVQDLAASLPARLIPPDVGEVLDLCSAPGGKAMQMAAAGHRVTAVDLSKSRLERLSQNLARTGLEAELVCADALTWEPGRSFDAILLDAPCSATGTFRRHPEVLYRARPAVIRESAELQAKLIERAAAWLKPGGTLVYSVCSVEPEEGEAIVAEFLTPHPQFAIAPGDLPDFVTPASDGSVRILPGVLAGHGGLDGFFAARLVRRAD
jgi:16S rRNA (cytosine967-C5)-methyltransferase